MRSMPSPAAKSTIRKIARQAVVRMAEKKVYRTSNIELAVSSATISNTWGNLSAIPQGAGFGQRTGREVRLQKLHVKGLIHNNATGTHIVRMVIGYFKDISVTPSTTTEIFEPTDNNTGPLTGTGIGGGNGIQAIVASLNKAKFTTVVDRLIKLGANSSIDANNVRTFEFTKPLRDAKIQFEDTTSGTGNQDKNLYIGFWTAEGGNDTAGGTTVEVSYTTALHYTDL